MMTILLPDFNQNAINFNPALGFQVVVDVEFLFKILIQY